DTAARTAQVQRETLRLSRPIVRLDYQLLPGNRVLYQGRQYALGRFKSQVVDPLRAHNWIAFRAYAPPQIPFGQVVASRRLLLDNGGDFDTYWDNLTEQDQDAQPARPSRRR
ncbi:MAG TPA: hypothetical protein VL359_20810, partial [bacterium]|nr:hypothetical protein [bacterium]